MATAKPTVLAASPAAAQQAAALCNESDPRIGSGPPFGPETTAVLPVQMRVANKTAGFTWQPKVVVPMLQNPSAFMPMDSTNGSVEFGKEGSCSFTNNGCGFGSPISGTMRSVTCDGWILVEDAITPANQNDAITNFGGVEFCPDNGFPWSCTVTNIG